MSLILKVASQSELHPEQLVLLFNEIAIRGHVLIVKSDGLREKERFTSIISFPENPSKAIRCDANTVLEAVHVCVLEYWNAIRF